MKKVFIMLVAAVAAIVLISSCASRDNIETEESSILVELQEINNAFMEEVGETKAITAKQVAAIAIADISGAVSGAKGGAKVGAYIGTLFGNPITGATFGAFLGGVGCGALCSWAVSPDTKSGTESEINYQSFARICEQVLSLEMDSIEYSSHNIQDRVNVDNDLLERTNLDTTSLRSGHLHNVVLAVLDNKIEIEGPKTKSSTGLSGVETSILYSDEMTSLFSDVTSGIIQGNYVDNSLPASVISLFIDVFSCYPDECEDVVEIINRYTEVINRSNELNQEEKACIKEALATALFSFNYWK